MSVVLLFIITYTLALYYEAWIDHKKATLRGKISQLEEDIARINSDIERIKWSEP